MQEPGALSPAELTRAVKQQASRLGFALAGVASPAAPAHLDVYHRWLEAGRHGNMDYLATDQARQRRADPRLILPECQSILVLGAPYAPPGAAFSPLAPDDGRVAAYAWGEDYHAVLAGRMQGLVAWLESSLGRAVPHRVYTDTGPLLERDLAQRAGLGWIGKNTCLIHPRLGSYFFVAEVLLGVELTPDAPFTADRCGSCTRCLRACPTQCILPDRTLDARRCISYLTIELKEAISADLRPQVGEWVFGCDVCQQVCPWNQRFAAPTPDPAFAPRPGLPEPALVELLALAPERFNQRFKDSPIRRSKRRGLLRNAAVALGNRRRGDPAPEGIRALAQGLQDAEPLVRQHAAWALGQLGGEAAQQVLLDAAQRETHSAVLTEINLALQ